MLQRPLVLVFLLFAGVARGDASPTTVPVAASGDVDAPYVLHLPGIGGHRFPDQALARGLANGGLNAEIFIFDWTGEDEGLSALTNTDRHAREARRVAEQIAFVARRQPQRRLIVTCHSGGAGVAAWALEQLPDDVAIDTWLMIAPALSPEFDLSPALRRVRGAAYQFYSATDPVLGFGTRNFGTIDRVKTDAAGRVGFRTPSNPVDATQYAKLRQIPYDRAWVRVGNFGDHIGPMMTPFARRVLAPLLQSGQLPRLTPTTRPADLPE